MARIQVSHGFLNALCNALGIDPRQHVTGVTIEANVNEVARVTIRELLTTDAAERVVNLIRAERDELEVTVITEGPK